MDTINSMIKDEYFDKGTDFSASQFAKPDYQFWVECNLEKNEDSQQGFKAWVGQLIHKESFNTPELDVIKEFSCDRFFDLEYSIGGSVDRLEYIGSGLWQIADIKTMGMYPAQAAFKEPKEEWKIQLSIYRWILKEYGINTVGSATIHQYVLGYQKNKVGMEEYNKIEIELLSLEETEELIRHKITVSKGQEPVSCDCPSYMCSYCDYSDACERSKK